MSSLSLYVDKGSWLNRLHPYTKLLYILAAICIPLIGGKLWLFPIIILCSICLLISGRCFRKSLPLIAFSFTMILVIFLVQGLFYNANEHVLFRIGALKFYEEGVLYAARISCNMLNMLLSFAVFVLTTSISEFVDELEKSGFPPKFGYVIISVFQIVPQMMKTKDTIVDAQRSRGMETEGNLLTRMKAFLPLISPVVMSALINTRERAIALEVRGFGRKNKKTILSDRTNRRIDKALGVLQIALIIVVVAWRIATCL